MNKKVRRLRKIVDILKIHNAMSVNELADLMKVSHMTIRRDMEYLADQSIIKIIHGGAVYNPVDIKNGAAEKYDLTSAISRYTDEKIRIGKKCASLFDSEEVIILDTGSTVEYVARFIPDNFPLTVICYTLNTLMTIHRKNRCKMIFAGGYFHKDTLMFESPEGIHLIKRNRASVAVISASGIDASLGITCASPYETEAKKATIKSSRKKILAVDSSKFGKIGAAYFAEMDDFDIIVTDSGISDEYKDIIKEKGIVLYTV